MKFLANVTLIIVMALGFFDSSMAEDSNPPSENNVWILPAKYQFVIPIHAGTFKMGGGHFYSTFQVSTLKWPAKHIAISGKPYVKGNLNTVECSFTPISNVVIGQDPVGEPYFGETGGGCDNGTGDQIGYALVGLQDPFEEYTEEDISGNLHYYRNGKLKFVASIPAVRPANKFFSPLQVRDMTTTHQRKEVSLAIVNPFSTEATITFTPLYRVQLNGGERIYIERPECIETRKLEPESGITLFSSQLLNEGCRGTSGTWIESDIPIAVSALMNLWKPEYVFYSLNVARIDE